jgi:hypothetical protein
MVNACKVHAHSTTSTDTVHPCSLLGIHSVPAVQTAAAVDNSSYPTVDPSSLASPAPGPLAPAAPVVCFDSAQLSE